MATTSQAHPYTPHSWRDRSYQVGLALFAMLAFGLCAYVSIDLTRGSGRIAAIWLPNAITLAFLLRYRTANEPLILAGCLIGNISANLAVGDTIPVAAVLSLANAAEILVALFLIRRWCGPDPQMDDSHDLLRFFLGAGIAAPFVSACIASIGLSWFGPFGLESLIRWALSDGLAMVVIAPSVVVFIDAASRLRWPTGREAIEWLLLFTLGTGLLLAVFSQTTYPLLFLAPLVVLAHAFYQGTVGTAVSVVKVAIIASIFTALGRGPIHLLAVPEDIQLLVLEGFLASCVIVGLPVAALLATRERATRELALLAENVTDGILCYDLDGICTYASPSAQTVLGVGASTLVGLGPAERGHPDSQEDIVRVRDRLMSGQSEKERLTYRRMLDGAGDQPVYIEADCAIARDSSTGKPGGIVVSARDVTDRVMLERKLKRATLHAENAARAKAQFLANMSHEIRTPMNGVIGFADLLCQMDLDDDAAHYAELIVSSGRSMMMLLNDILDISKIESGQLVLAYEKVALAKLAEDCVQLHRASAERKDVGLTLTIDDEVPELAVTDPLRLRQIILNLIGNAVKFTENGSIEVSVQLEEDRLAIAVEDSGIGIDPARVEQIFDPFVQEEGSTTRRFGGTGLGLSISRQLAELLGGTLSVQSRPGVGSRFTLRIPLEEAPATPGRNPENEKLPQSSPVRSGARILLAEDHDVNRMLVTAMLEQLGQEIEIAHDGLEAMSKAIEAETEGRPFDLVLMDVQMPGCDGYSATRMIRQSGISANRLPIIALTANAFPEDVAAAREAGMQSHLAKPLVFDDLGKALSRWLPVRIIEENPGKPSTDAPSRGHSDEVMARWHERRSEAIEAVSMALREEGLEGVRVEELARTVHKLAGTAGMFGEDDLGDKAAALERALRAGVENEVRRRLAEELVSLA